MAQILDPIPDGHQSILLCCYVNATNHIQIARITNIANWYFERVVFPGQRLVFEALPQAHLEIHTGMMASSILSDTIPCERLCISDVMDDDFDDDDFEPSSTVPAIEPHIVAHAAEALPVAVNEGCSIALTPIFA